MARTLKQRIDDLEAIVSSLCDINTSDAANSLMDEARVMAIYSIALDLARRQGVSADSFFRHFQARFHWWHDHYLRREEDADPRRAAELDPRTLEQAAVDASYPSLFDPPPPEQT